MNFLNLKMTYVALAETVTQRLVGSRKFLVGPVAKTRLSAQNRRLLIFITDVKRYAPIIEPPDVREMNRQSAAKLGTA